MICLSSVGNSPCIRSILSTGSHQGFHWETPVGWCAHFGDNPSLWARWTPLFGGYVPLSLCHPHIGQLLLVPLLPPFRHTYIEGLLPVCQSEPEGGGWVRPPHMLLVGHSLDHPREVVASLQAADLSAGRSAFLQGWPWTGSYTGITQSLVLAHPTVVLLVFHPFQLGFVCGSPQHSWKPLPQWRSAATPLSRAEASTLLPPQHSPACIGCVSRVVCLSATPRGPSRQFHKKP